MCFEFEWLYWAQMAQEEEQRRKDAAKQVDPLNAAPVRDPQAVPQRQENPQPVHA